MTTIDHARLEAAEKRADDLERAAEDHVLDAEATYERMDLRVRKAEHARNQLAAVLMHVEDYVTRHYLDTEMGRRVIEALSVEPGDALREVKADVWDEGYFRRMDDYPFDPEERDNPYRAREEQS